jgi:Glu-tRNA(Gln) amidotransferase subunit E-like FAD-binding protein
MVKYRSERLDNEISGDDIDDLLNSNNFDLLVDLVSEFAGMFTSLSNASKLAEAEGKLSKAAGQIKEVEKALLETAHSDALKFVTAERMINRLRKRLVERPSTTTSSLPDNVKSDVLATLDVRAKVLDLLSEDIERAKGQGQQQIVQALPRVMVSAASKTPVPS